MKKVRAERFATMSVYEHCRQRVDGYVDPPNASVQESLGIFEQMLVELQDHGVKPGTKLRIIIEIALK